MGKLVVVFDDNGISIDGSTQLAVNDNQLMRFEACGWHVSECDGHDPDAISEAINSANRKSRQAVTDCLQNNDWFWITKQSRNCRDTRGTTW